MIRQRKKNAPACWMLAMLLLLPMTGLHAMEREEPFPQYGTGPVQVRIYTDYFCPPCGAMKLSVKPLLQELLQRNAITLTLVDAPFSSNSRLYGTYFLYALKKQNDQDHAFRVKDALYNAASDRRATTEADIEALFTLQEIPFEPFDPVPVFDRYNDLIREDRLRATPTCVIINNDEKEVFIGTKDILEALNRLL